MSKGLLYSLLFFNILLLVGGQLIWKHALQQMGTLTVGHVLLSPWIYLGGILYVIATALWFVILKHLELSIAYPLQSLAYVLGIVASRLFFAEPIPWTRWVGVAVLMISVTLIAWES